VPFDIEAARANARQVNPGIEILEISCATGKGMDEWRAWLDERRRSRQQSAGSSASSDESKQN
jgi:hydrogenase nickel incorporation protein HypB